MAVVAIPNRDVPPAEDALSRAAVVIASLVQLRPELLDELSVART